MDTRARPPRGIVPPRGRVLLKPEWLIDAWLDLLPPRQATGLRTLHQAVLAASPSLLPAVRWGNLVYLREGRPVAQLTPYREAVHLHLTLLRPTRQHRPGPGAGTQRFRHGRPIDSDTVTWQVMGLLRALAR
jgi:antitoxin (DNA-binding transcriptional repressor) of toxin-antitoxin stability system